MHHYLTTILTHKRREVEKMKRENPLPLHLQEKREKRSLKLALTEKKMGIIAEFKRSSPSEGEIDHQRSLEEMIAAYEAGGAAALSILTDTTFFKGDLSFLERAKKSSQLPVLMKDFILDPYQLHLANQQGADAVLLIAAALSPQECQELIREAHALNLEVLLEIHEEKELPYIAYKPDLVGINNRNLTTFKVDLSNAIQLINKLPTSIPAVAESGIHSTYELETLKKAGFRNFLIGSSLMKSNDPSLLLQEMLRLC